MLAIAEYPFVAANLDFSMVVTSPSSAPITIAEDAGKCSDAAGAVTKSCYIEVDDDVIVGIIGRAPNDLFLVTNAAGVKYVDGIGSEDFQPLESAVGQVLKQVDLLEEQGASVIILLDHAGDLTDDSLLSTGSLRGIDIIVAAGSTGFLGQNDDPVGPFNLLREGDSRTASYPIVQSDMEGKPLLVVSTDPFYRYIGHLIVDFDKDGNILTWDGRSGPIATTEDAVDLLNETLGSMDIIGGDTGKGSKGGKGSKVGKGNKGGKGSKGGKGGKDTDEKENSSPGLSVRQILDDLLATPIVLSNLNVVGTTAKPLNGFRDDVRTRETNLGRLVAESSIWAAQAFVDANGPPVTIDMALKNGGGFRDSISGPRISEADVNNALRFDNKLAIIELSATQLLAALENAYSRWPFDFGGFAQLAGLRVTFDASNTALQRLTSLSTPSRVVEMVQIDSMGTVVDNIVVGGVLQGDPSRTFIMATNDFLATGGDGYVSFAEGSNLGTTTLGEQQILQDYISIELGGNINISDPPTPPNVINATPSLV